MGWLDDALDAVGDVATGWFNLPGKAVDAVGEVIQNPGRVLDGVGGLINEVKNLPVVETPDLTKPIIDTQAALDAMEEKRQAERAPKGRAATIFFGEQGAKSSPTLAKNILLGG